MHYFRNRKLSVTIPMQRNFQYGFRNRFLPGRVFLLFQSKKHSDWRWNRLIMNHFIPQIILQSMIKAQVIKQF